MVCRSGPENIAFFEPSSLTVSAVILARKSPWQLWLNLPQSLLCVSNSTLKHRNKSILEQVTCLCSAISFNLRFVCLLISLNFTLWGLHTHFSSSLMKKQSWPTFTMSKSFARPPPESSPPKPYGLSGTRSGSGN